jgi:hypothetical protein
MTLLEPLPAFRVMVEPFSRPGRGSNLLPPLIEIQILPGDATGPHPVDEDSVAVSSAGRVVGASDLDVHSIFLQAAGNARTGPAGPVRRLRAAVEQPRVLVAAEVVSARALSYGSPTPPTDGSIPGSALQARWSAALEAAGMPDISLYEGTKHSFATDAIRRGVPARHLQTFLGHASIESARRYACLAENAALYRRGP